MMFSRCSSEQKGNPLGLDNVPNYDGRWTDYGNVVGAPIEKA